MLEIFTPMATFPLIELHAAVARTVEPNTKVPGTGERSFFLSQVPGTQIYQLLEITQMTATNFIFFSE